MDRTPDGAAAAWSAAFGAVLLMIAWICWSGRWKSWTKLPMAGNYPLTFVPAVGFLFLILGLSEFLPKPLDLAVGSLAFPALLAGFVLSIWEPRWFGPRWWRESPPGPDVSKRYDADQVATYAPLPPERNSELVARAARDDNALITSRWASLYDDTAGKPSGIHTEGMISGRLLLYPDELVFAANRRDDVLRGGPTIRTLAAADVTGARKVNINPRANLNRPLRHDHVLIHTERETWRLEIPSADRVMRYLRKHYLNPKATEHPER